MYTASQHSSRTFLSQTIKEGKTAVKGARARFPPSPNPDMCVVSMLLVTDSLMSLPLYDDGQCVVTMAPSLLKINYIVAAHVNMIMCITTTIA